MRRILAIDGGGIRGIIPAAVLVALEQQTGKPIRESFDFVAGTSTGALIAAAACAGVSASRMLDIYRGDASQIFTPPQPIAEAERLIVGYSYNPDHIRDVLVSEFGPMANATLNDSPIRILITATAIDSHPWYFVQDNPKNARTAGSLRIVDCAVASSSAPTYFKPWRMHVNGKQITLLDGGGDVTG